MCFIFLNWPFCYSDNTAVIDWTVRIKEVQDHLIESNQKRFASEQIKSETVRDENIIPHHAKLFFIHIPKVSIIMI